MTKQFAFLAISACLLLSSCNFNATYNNREEDKEEAEQVAVKFYYLLRDKNYDGSYDLLSPKFLAVTDTTKIKELFVSAEQKLGEIKDQSLLTWETNIVEGSNPSSQYVLIYDVKRSNFNSMETIRLEKENNKILILGYDVKSEGWK